MALTAGQASHEPTDRVAADARPLRIGVIGTRGIPSSYSGLESIAESLYGTMADRGHQVTVYAREGYLREPVDRHRGVHVLRTPFLRRKSIETLSHVAASLAHALAEDRYDVIHFHAIAPALLTRACRLRGMPTVSWVQGLDWQRAKWSGAGSRVIRLAEREMVRGVDEVMVVSRHLQRYYAESYGRETELVPNGVEPSDLDAARPEEVRRFGLEPGKYLLFAGRNVPEKRIHDLIRAFRGVDTPYRLAIVGEGGYTDGYVAELRALASDDPRVVFTGLQSGLTLHSLFRFAAAYVQASELEGLPLSVLECLDHAVPPIASDIPPHRELLEPIGGYDLFFDPGDVPALRERIERVLGNPGRYGRWAHEARTHVHEQYSWPTVADRIEEISRRAIQRHRGR